MTNKVEILRTIPEEKEINIPYDWTLWLEFQKKRYQHIHKYKDIVNMSFYNHIMYHRR